MGRFHFDVTLTVLYRYFAVTLTWLCTNFKRQWVYHNALLLYTKIIGRGVTADSGRCPVGASVRIYGKRDPRMGASFSRSLESSTAHDSTSDDRSLRSIAPTRRTHPTTGVDDLGILWIVISFDRARRLGAAELAAQSSGFREGLGLEMPSALNLAAPLRATATQPSTLR